MKFRTWLNVTWLQYVNRFSWILITIAHFMKINWKPLKIQNMLWKLYLNANSDRSPVLNLHLVYFSFSHTAKKIPFATLKFIYNNQSMKKAFMNDGWVFEKQTLIFCNINYQFAKLHGKKSIPDWWIFDQKGLSWAHNRGKFIAWKCEYCERK